MNTVMNSFDEQSPFHAGEQALQASVGRRESMEAFGRRVIRSYLPDQHREFYQQLAFVVIGAVDQDGWPWSSLLPGRPGFITSPDDTTLRIDAVPGSGDSLSASIRAGAPVGLLGIDIATRRRNRMNGQVNIQDAAGFSISVDQSFGNCPQYIQKRSLKFIREPEALSDLKTSERFTTLSGEAQKLIRSADTFFVSSYVNSSERPDIEGVDVSHRGGRPGFVLVAGNSLTIPEFPGNFHFNTLGNFLLNPKAGLVFPDFNTGDLLQLTGTVELLKGDAPALLGFRGLERGWRFTVSRGNWVRDLLPFRFTSPEPSPNSELTDDWQTARARLEAETKRNTWRPHRVVRVEDESSVIRSFYLEPTDGAGVPEYRAGQHVPVKVRPDDGDRDLIRTYTLSSAPADSVYRISVRREDQGGVSRFLHDHVKAGAVLELKGPRGDFHIDPAEQRPALLIAGGVGVTPMISMARHVVNEGIRTRYLRPLTVFHSTRNVEQRAFAESFRELERLTDGRVRYHSIVSAAGVAGKVGVDFAGRLTKDVFRSALPLDDYDCFLCGPPSFMQTVYSELRLLGISDQRIFAEAFGPASLQREPDLAAPAIEPPEEADIAVIRFVRSGFEHRWERGDGTLLEVAEQLGLTPDSGCRAGSCGTCATGLISGTAVNRTPISGEPDSQQVLICSAVPGKGCNSLEIDL